MKLLGAIGGLVGLLFGTPLYLLESGEVPDQGYLVRLWRVEGVTGTPTPIGATLFPAPIQFRSLLASRRGFYLIGGEQDPRRGWVLSIQFRNRQGRLEQWWRGERGVGVAGGVCRGKGVVVVERGEELRWGAVPPRLTLRWGRGKFLKLLRIEGSYWLFSQQVGAAGTILRWGPLSEGPIHRLLLSPGVQLTDLLQWRGRLVGVGVWHQIPHLWVFPVEGGEVSGRAFQLPAPVVRLKGVSTGEGVVLVGEVKGGGLCWCDLSNRLNLKGWRVIKRGEQIGLTGLFRVDRFIVAVGGVRGESLRPGIWWLANGEVVREFLVPQPLPLSTSFVAGVVPATPTPTPGPGPSRTPKPHSTTPPPGTGATPPR